MTEQTKQLDYVNTTFEMNGAAYRATELPFDRDFSDLTFNLPASKCSAIYAAMAIAQKTNSKMLRDVSQSPTYPIKENDLIWIALTSYKKDSRDDTKFLKIVYPQPFVIQTDPNGKLKATAVIEKGKPHTHISSNTLSYFINPLENINYAGVRLYRHVDRTSKPETEVIKPIEEPMSEFETEIFTRGPVDIDLNLDDLITQDLQDETMEKLTKRIQKPGFK